METIGPIARTGADYYIDVTRGEIAGYYTDNIRHGRWLGSGAKAFFLTGLVEKEMFERVFDGWHPTENLALVRNPGASSRRPGFDITYTAPKSVSIVGLLSDPETRQAVSDAQWEAVKRIIDYLEQNLVFSRIGKGGLEKVPARLFVAAFEHHTSRNNDPNIHIHCCLLNVALREDGTTGALIHLPLFKSKMELGARFRAELALQLEHRLGLEIVRDGSLFEINGVPIDLMQAFSTRRQAIVEALEKKGLHSAYASAVTTLQTRPEKINLSQDELFSRWEATGREYGFTVSDIQRLLHCYHPMKSIEQERVERIAQTLQALSLETHIRRLERLARVYQQEHDHSLIRDIPEPEYF